MHYTDQPWGQPRTSSIKNERCVEWTHMMLCEIFSDDYEQILISDKHYVHLSATFIVFIFIDCNLFYKSIQTLYEGTINRYFKTTITNISVVQNRNRSFKQHVYTSMSDIYHVVESRTVYIGRTSELLVRNALHRSAMGAAPNL